MKYPYFLLDKQVKPSPVVRLAGSPHEIVLDSQMVDKALKLMGDSRAINDWFDQMISDSGCRWAIGSYLEDREAIMSRYPHMNGDKRYFHLGLDICAPAGTPVFAPLDGSVFESGVEEGEGNYGGYVILKHELPDTNTFYTLYGHMNIDSLPARGSLFRAGERLALIGDLHENGGWNHHTHIQVITERGRELGYFSKGYCSKDILEYIEDICPNPMPLVSAGFQNF